MNTARKCESSPRKTPILLRTALGFFALACLLGPQSASAALRQSTHYEQFTETTDAGGSPASSAHYAILGTIGGITGTSTSASLKDSDGFLVQVFSNYLPIPIPGGPYSTWLGSDVGFDASISNDPDAAYGDSIATFVWDLDNDGSYDTTGATPVISSTTLQAHGLGLGIHSIRLRVTDSFGASATRDTTLTITLPPAINVLDGATQLTDGSATPVNLGIIPVGHPLVKTFTITNDGGAALNLGTFSTDGSHAADFSSSLPGSNTVISAESTTFTVTFSPVNAGVKTAVLHIASNVPGSTNPFDIHLTATGLSFTSDTDGDGLNDAAEFNLSALGYDWQVSQPTLVNTLFSNLDSAPSNVNAAGFYALSQVQALNANAPLLTRNPATGKFKLTLGIGKSTDLTHFTPFPFTAPETSINGQGKLEFEFTAPDNAAFFRLEAE